MLRARAVRQGSGPRTVGLPIWTYLVALSLIPSLLLPAFGASLAVGRVNAYHDAEHVSAAMTTIEQLERLVSAAVAEGSAAAAADVIAPFHLSAADVRSLTALTGLGSVQPVPAARAATDRALKDVAAHSRDPRIERLPQALAESRAVVPPPSDEGLATAWRAFAAYQRFVEQVTAVETAISTEVVAGRYGVGSGSLLLAASQLEHVTAVVAAQQHQMVSLVLVALVPADQKAQAVGALSTATATYQDRADSLPAALSSTLASRWQQLEAARSTTEVEALAGSDVAHPPSLTGISPQLISTVSTVAAATQRFLAFLAEAVDAGTSTARHESQAAARTATVALVMTGLGLALTAAALLLVGGVLRRRLGALAGTARAFSDGVLEVAPVRGPREVAAASAALNDAVAGLSRLQFQADLLASGELDSPELERAVEGPLGAAIHESVARLVRATRSAEVLRQELAHEATHDPLTGLLNRHAATELLESALRARTRRTHDVAIAFVDLDKFKECNDTLGHQAGDLVLQVTARRMCDTLGDRATLCRLGGDEFLVIASPGIARSALTSLARELVERVSEPIPMTDREIAIGASVGIAFAGPGDTASDLMRHADLALYTAKAGGRGLVHVHETAPDSPAELGAGDAAAPAAADDPAVTLP